jgi:hypothetical protein
MYKAWVSVMWKKEGAPLLRSIHVYHSHGWVNLWSIMTIIVIIARIKLTRWRSLAAVFSTQKRYRENKMHC